ncbi:MAG: UDP-2,3-diacylglucosamine diphosphatase [Rhodospirillales bacterium]|nr:UDP-2,3-diacylglucosamine diphosphatase [Rhodospirillales bacterium]MCB9995504.1 UDP-2,3-diacylglucosamine diphosphatase [Rhodospirillales bacterium]
MALTYKTVFLSDTHLGTDAALAERLFEFLQNVDCEELVMVGDIIDGWFLETHKHKPMPEMHRRVLDAVFAKIENGTKVTWVTGNHDGKLRGKAFAALRHREGGFHGINITNAYAYAQPVPADERQSGEADIRRWKVIHGDHFEPKAFRQNRFMRGVYRAVDYVWAGASIYASGLSRLTHDWFRIHSAPLGWLKHAGKSVIGSFSKSAAKPRNDKTDGVICGHIHKAELRKMGPKYYANTGDWVESCTALAVDAQGRMELVRWGEKREQIPALQGQRYPRETDPNPYEAMRVKHTYPALRAIGRLWAGTNRKELFAKAAKAKGTLEKGDLAQLYEDQARKLTALSDALKLHQSGEFNRQAMVEDKAALKDLKKELKQTWNALSKIEDRAKKLDKYRGALFPGKYAPDGKRLPHRLEMN